MRRHRRARTILTTLAALLLLSGAAARAADDKPIWEALGLASKDVAGHKVYYEKSIEAKLGPQFDAYAKFQAGRAKRDELIAKTPEVVKEIERTIGGDVDDKFTAMAEDLVRRMPQGFGWVYDVPVCIVTKPTLIAYMEAGHAVPLYALSADHKSLTMTANFNVKSGDAGAQPPPPAPPSVLVLPPGINPGEPAAAELLNRADGRTIYWGALHEIAEFRVFERIKHQGAYSRWVSDGIANTVADRVATKFFGKDEATTYGGIGDPAKFEDVRRGANLAYWFAVPVAIEIPTPTERKLTDARYTFATVEVRHLVDAHGEKAIGAICGAMGAAGGGADSPAAVVAAIKSATGEDVQPRLSAYQEAATVDEEIKLRQQHGGEAAKHQDFRGMISDVLRVREITPLDPDVHRVMPELLLRAGYAAFLRATYGKEMKLLSSPQNALLRGLTQKRYVAVSLEAGQAMVFADVAEEVLKFDPTYVPAQAARMVRLNRQGQTDAAKAIAAKIVSMAAEKSAANRLAHEVLGTAGAGTSAAGK